MSAMYPIDYSRGPLWWWSVKICRRWTWHEFRQYKTFVRAADAESAKQKASRILADLPSADESWIVVLPMLNRSGLSCGTHEFAGYVDE